MQVQNDWCVDFGFLKENYSFVTYSASAIIFPGGIPVKNLLLTYMKTTFYYGEISTICYNTGVGYWYTECAGFFS